MYLADSTSSSRTVFPEAESRFRLQVMVIEYRYVECRVYFVNVHCVCLCIYTDYTWPNVYQTKQCNKRSRDMIYTYY